MSINRILLDKAIDQVNQLNRINYVMKIELELGERMMKAIDIALEKINVLRISSYQILNSYIKIANCGLFVFFNPRWGLTYNDELQNYIAKVHDKDRIERLQSLHYLKEECSTMAQQSIYFMQKAHYFCVILDAIFLYLAKILMVVCDLCLGEELIKPKVGFNLGQRYPAKS